MHLSNLTSESALLRPTYVVASAKPPYACPSSPYRNSLLLVTRRCSRLTSRERRCYVVAGEGRSANRTKWSAPQPHASIHAPRSFADEGHAAELVRYRMPNILRLCHYPGNTACISPMNDESKVRCHTTGMAGIARSSAYLCWYRPASWTEHTQGPVSNAAS